MLGHREEIVVDTIPNGRHIYAGERTCINCSHRDECIEHREYTMSFPNAFRRREGWSQQRMTMHMKSVLGGICGNFENRYPHINRAHLERMAAKGELEYDL